MICNSWREVSSPNHCSRVDMLLQCHNSTKYRDARCFIFSSGASSFWYQNISSTWRDVISPNHVGNSCWSTSSRVSDWRPESSWMIYAELVRSLQYSMFNAVRWWSNLHWWRGTLHDLTISFVTRKEDEEPTMCCTFSSQDDTTLSLFHIVHSWALGGCGLILNLGQSHIVNLSRL